ncbi:hypothetical protein AB834_02835 [PVC group bacterium (ex Bugula neritina AB1)]|nr:hypothetical protein AB834_02835 [PVC group bacterium (ex Bugula neritina AB1)]
MIKHLYYRFFFHFFLILSLQDISVSLSPSTPFEESSSSVLIYDNNATEVQVNRNISTVNVINKTNNISLQKIFSVTILCTFFIIFSALFALKLIPINQVLTVNILSISFLTVGFIGNISMVIILLIKQNKFFTKESYGSKTSALSDIKIIFVIFLFNIVLFFAGLGLSVASLYILTNPILSKIFIATCVLNILILSVPLGWTLFKRVQKNNLSDSNNANTKSSITDSTVEATESPLFGSEKDLAAAKEKEAKEAADKRYKALKDAIDHFTGKYEVFRRLENPFFPNILPSAVPEIENLCLEIEEKISNLTQKESSTYLPIIIDAETDINSFRHCKESIKEVSEKLRRVLDEQKKISESFLTNELKIEAFDAIKPLLHSLNSMIEKAFLPGYPFLRGLFDHQVQEILNLFKNQLNSLSVSKDKNSSSAKYISLILVDMKDSLIKKLEKYLKDTSGSTKTILESVPLDSLLVTYQNILKEVKKTYEKKPLLETDKWMLLTSIIDILKEASSKQDQKYDPFIHHFFQENIINTETSNLYIKNLEIEYKRNNTIKTYHANSKNIPILKRIERREGSLENILSNLEILNIDALKDSDYLKSKAIRSLKVFLTPSSDNDLQEVYSILSETKDLFETLNAYLSIQSFSSDTEDPIQNLLESYSTFDRLEESLLKKITPAAEKLSLDNTKSKLSIRIISTLVELGDFPCPDLKKIFDSLFFSETSETEDKNNKKIIQNCFDLYKLNTYYQSIEDKLPKDLVELIATFDSEKWEEVKTLESDIVVKYKKAIDSLDLFENFQKDSEVDEDFHSFEHLFKYTKKLSLSS